MGVKIYLKGGEVIEIRGEGLKFAQQALSAKADRRRRLRRGSLIRVEQGPKGTWHISQLPEVEAAVVSVDPHDGAIRALVGGFEFGRNKFNHVTQALRQPGSSFEPFIYSAALEKGITALVAVSMKFTEFDPIESTAGVRWSGEKPMPCTRSWPR